MDTHTRKDITELPADGKCHLRCSFLDRYLTKNTKFVLCCAFGGAGGAVLGLLARRYFFSK